MKEYLELIIFPFVHLKRRELDLLAEHPALAIFDIFKGQQTEDIRGMLEKENILIVPVPPNCTDRLQPMDLSVNKPLKEFMRKKFQEWYAIGVLMKERKCHPSISSCLL